MSSAGWCVLVTWVHAQVLASILLAAVLLRRKQRTWGKKRAEPLTFVVPHGPLVRLVDASMTIQTSERLVSFYAVNDSPLPMRLAVHVMDLTTGIAYYLPPDAAVEDLSGLM